MRWIQRSTHVHALLLATSLPLLACGGDGGGNGTTDPSGSGEVRATVTLDAAPEAGVTVNLYAAGGGAPAQTRTTGGDGTVVFTGVEPGAREVEVEVPADAELTQGEDARKDVQVVADQTATVSFALASRTGGEVVEVLAQDDLTFSPAQITISPGTTVRWRNTGVMLHTVTPDGHSEWVSASLDETGAMFEHTFDEAGTYDYFCQPHVSFGMTGQIIVQ